MQNNWIPPIKTITHIVDAHPATGSPKQTLLNITKSKNINDTKVMVTPNHDTIFTEPLKN